MHYDWACKLRRHLNSETSNKCLSISCAVWRDQLIMGPMTSRFASFCNLHAPRGLHTLTLLLKPTDHIYWEMSLLCFATEKQRRWISREVSVAFSSFSDSLSFTFLVFSDQVSGRWCWKYTVQACSFVALLLYYCNHFVGQNFK